MVHSVLLGLSIERRDVLMDGVLSDCLAIVNEIGLTSQLLVFGDYLVIDESVEVFDLSHDDLRCKLE